MRLLLVAALAPGCLLGWGGFSGDTARGGRDSDAAGDDSGFDFSQFQAGIFQFTTTAVGDACFDGGFTVLFMPEGAATDWATTTELPAWPDLPITYTIELQEPFSSMEITVSAGADGEMVMDGAQQTDVELGADSWPGCLVEMDISASLDIVGADAVQGSAQLNTAGFEETSCPAVDSDPCTITLDLTAVCL